MGEEESETYSRKVRDGEERAVGEGQGENSSRRWDIVRGRLDWESRRLWRA